MSSVSRQSVHLLHIGKTGGSALKLALKPYVTTPRYRIHLHPHHIKLRHIQAGERIVFFLRDPIHRFVSGFYSRQRQGKPRHFSPWSAAEKDIFAHFQTPNALALALSSSDTQEQARAKDAMQSILHVQDSYWDWFENESYFLSRRADILFVGFQESLDKDFELLKQCLDIPREVLLPRDARLAHKNAPGLDTRLDEEARENLRNWYARDYDFLELCTTHIRRDPPLSRGVHVQPVQAENRADKRVVFVGGVHRSGTSFLHAALRAHPDISGFVDTGVPEDEGQHLQSVYPSARTFGGPGRFGFRSESFMDETHPLATTANAEQLYAEWSVHWDIRKPYLLEKSPPNIVRMRFLQKLFPTASFVMILRHPLPVAYATLKWCPTGILPLIEHTLRCYERLLADKAHISRLFVCRYEDLLAHPPQLLTRTHTFLGLPAHPSPLPIDPNGNTKYFQRWRHDLDCLGPDAVPLLRAMLETFAERLAAFGYNLEQPEHFTNVDWLEAG